MENARIIAELHQKEQVAMSRLVRHVKAFSLMSIIMLGFCACSSSTENSNGKMVKEIDQCDLKLDTHQENEIIQSCVEVYDENWQVLSASQKWNALHFAQEIRDESLVKYAKDDLSDVGFRINAFNLNVEADSGGNIELFDDDRLILPNKYYTYLIELLENQEKIAVIKMTVLTLLDNLSLQALGDLKKIDIAEYDALVAEVKVKLETNELSFADESMVEKFHDHSKAK